MAELMLAVLANCLLDYRQALSQSHPVACVDSSRTHAKLPSHAVVPNGTATGLDIGLSNFSLSLITLSFYTMCKSTTPVFLLAFCFLWGIERCGPQPCLIMPSSQSPCCLWPCRILRVIPLRSLCSGLGAPL